MNKSFLGRKPKGILSIVAVGALLSLSATATANSRVYDYGYRAPHSVQLHDYGYRPAHGARAWTHDYWPLGHSYSLSGVSHYRSNRLHDAYPVPHRSYRKAHRVHDRREHRSRTRRHGRHH